MNPPAALVVARESGTRGIGLMLLFSAQWLAAQGWLVGDAGGFERDAVLFDRERGMVWSAITGPDGRFESTPVPPGTYLALSHGRVSPVVIREGRRTEILWADQPGYEADTETWVFRRRDQPPAWCAGQRKSSSLQPATSSAPMPQRVGQVEAHTDLHRFEPHQGARACGWQHELSSQSGTVPRKLEPPLTQLIWQTVAVRPGKRHILSAWILTAEEGGGWNRNDRLRLCADPEGRDRLADARTVDDRFVTPWYTTRGQWRKVRLQFTPQTDRVQVGVQFYQWWLLRENPLFVDEVRLVQLEP